MKYISSLNSLTHALSCANCAKQFFKHAQLASHFSSTGTSRERKSQQPHTIARASQDSEHVTLCQAGKQTTTTKKMVATRLKVRRGVT